MSNGRSFQRSRRSTREKVVAKKQQQRSAQRVQRSLLEAQYAAKFIGESIDLSAFNFDQIKKVAGDDEHSDVHVPGDDPGTDTGEPD